jgi:hypothetical protein
MALYRVNTLIFFGAEFARVLLKLLKIGISMGAVAVGI